MSALIDFRSPAVGADPVRLAFGAPRECLRAMTLDQVVPLIAQVDAMSRAGAWCVGHVCYEAAAAFDDAFVTHPPADVRQPLASFAVYDSPLGDFAALEAPASENADVQWRTGPLRTAFDSVIAAILAAIADGEVYQVNATAPISGTMTGDPFALFAALRRAQPNAYAAFLDFGLDDDRILSVSPELFFDWRGGRLLARPMKGTAPRGSTAAADLAQAQFLRSAPKERAENLMIVDLLRNDMSRIAESFSVRVPELFATEAWPTVWQMSSAVVARTRPRTTLVDVFRALFPCGSVTGAPKVQAMRLINRLELEPRGVYCGAIGVVRPGGSATFNVPIRTLVLRKQGEVTLVRCGIGSGITADATSSGEWNEWRHKRAFVDRASRAFELLETLRLEDGVLFDLEAHLDRLEGAARHFDFVSPSASARIALATLCASNSRGTWRVRLLVERTGKACAEAFALTPTPQPVRVSVADRPLAGSDSEFVRFKTTRRAHYDDFAPEPGGAFDTLLWNERGELTEFTRGNVALRIDGRWLTPTKESGLLAGLARERLLADGTLGEATLMREDLARADGLAFFNNLRGWLVAEL